MNARILSSMASLLAAGVPSPGAELKTAPLRESPPDITDGFRVRPFQPGPAAIRFGKPSVFRRVKNALRGNHAVKLLPPVNSPDPASRQFRRAKLRVVAARDVKAANPQLGRHERRMLARAYAAKAYREQFKAAA